ncbi:MAG: DNA mismatch repair endonuclease MutL [Clostridia bacterium]|nr:DNA mismatch repair endonuclease MutL [Clostridia bacterium]
MGKIVVLDENTSNKIAAGEVVERPASVVKELVENSMDAGASSISVEIKNGGISFIKVADNGSGIEEDDAEIAFERHATSKIRNSNDLEAISTLGFRGEALASIAAVSSVELTTRVQKNAYGILVNIQGGAVKDVKQTGCPVGTTFVVRELFYNTPARFKFLKKDSTEAGYISDIISRIALSRPEVSFRLISNHSTVIHTPGNNDLLSTVFSIYGKEIAKNVLKVDYEDTRFKIKGFAGKPEIARSNRNYQSIYINGRYIKSKIIASAIDEAYKTFLMKNKFPFIVLNLEVNPMMVDVNVHPTKMEVRFSEEQEVFRSVYHAVSNALLEKSLVRDAHLLEKQSFKMEVNPGEAKSYEQQNLDFKTPSIKETVNVSYLKDINKTDLSNKPYEKVFPEVKHDKKLVEKERVLYEEVKHEPEKKDSAAKLVEVFNPVTGPVSEKRIIAGENSNLTESKASNNVFPPTANKPIEEDLDLEEEKGKESIVSFSDFKIIGQVFSTYIILQDGEDMILIDQHAAHERIMYEKLKSGFLNQESLAQMLLAPVVIELTHQEIKFLEEEKEFFNQLGFIYENFGNNSIIIRAVPGTEDGSLVKDTFLQVIDKVLVSGKANFERIADDVLFTMACKAAVKANKKLDPLEINEILKGLSAIKNPYTCPHGRPTVIKITKYELEKMFKRII